jgi:hypothetical protein
MSVHPVSAAGFGSSAGLRAYEAARPSYPPDAIAHCIQKLGLGPGARVLDLAAGAGLGDLDRWLQLISCAACCLRGFGPCRLRSRRRPPPVTCCLPHNAAHSAHAAAAAGTGKLTRQLLDLDLGLDVAAAEPNPGMIEGFKRACPGVRIEAAAADALPFGSGEFDAVFVGQAYHCR